VLQQGFNLIFTSYPFLPPSAATDKNNQQNLKEEEIVGDVMEIRLVSPHQVIPFYD